VRSCGRTTLARLARVDPILLRPICHRSEQAQMDLMVIRGRAALVVARTSLVNTARGLAKSVGERLPKVDAEALDMEDAKALPEALRLVLKRCCKA
jgi:transposase